MAPSRKNPGPLGPPVLATSAVLPVHPSIETAMAFTAVEAEANPEVLGQLPQTALDHPSLV